MTLEVLQPTPFLLISSYKQNQFLAKPILLGFKLVFSVFHNMVVKKVYMTRFSNIRRCFNPLHRKSTMKPLFVLKNFTMWSQNALLIRNFFCLSEFFYFLPCLTRHSQRNACDLSNYIHASAFKIPEASHILSPFFLFDVVDFFLKL